MSWQLSGQFAGYASSGGTDSLAVSLTRTFASGTSSEFHDWALDVPSSSVKAGSVSGDWTFAPPATSAGSGTLASINIRFKATKATNMRCQTGSGTKYVGTLTGRFLLDTGLSKSGTVGNKAIAFSGASFTREDNCTARLPASKCFGGVDFAGLLGSKGQVLEGAARRVGDVVEDQLYVARLQFLSTPPLALRIDGATELAPHVVLKGDVGTVTTRPGGIITGSATVTGSEDPSGGSTRSCQLDGTKHTETTSYWTKATMSSPSTARMTAHLTLSPPLLASASAPGALQNTVVH
jgi:hypothetical protein